MTHEPLDETDLAICAELSRDGRASYTDLGRRTGLSTSAVHQRVKRLEQRGVIVGYRAVVDPAAAGRALSAFVAIRPIEVSEPDDYPDRLRHISEIESCYSVAGDDSYLLHVRVAGSLELESLLTRIRQAANVSTRSTVVLSTPYEGRPPDVQQ